MEKEIKYINQSALEYMKDHEKKMSDTLTFLDFLEILSNAKKKYINESSKTSITNVYDLGDISAEMKKQFSKYGP